MGRLSLGAAHSYTAAMSWRSIARGPKPPLGLLVPALLLLSACRPAPQEDGKRTNVLLIVVDTLRADHLPFHGYSRDTAPALAHLAGESVVFDRAFTVMSHTLPAHVSLMTGRHPGKHQVLSNGWTYDGRFTTLAERLRSGGYSTGAFVSSFVLVATSGLAAGFETYQSPDARSRRVPGEVTGHRATSWLKEQADRPFFAFVHYFDTHQPYDTPADAPWPFAADAAFETRLRALGVWESSIDEVSEKPITLDGRPLSLPEAVNAYDNEILRVDGLIGRLLATLDETGVSEDTLVIFTSDHGEGLGQHGYYSHGLHLYEEQIRVPLIVRPPVRWGWKPHHVQSAVSLLDIVPTVLDLVGAETDPGFDGRSLIPELLDQASGEPDRWLLLQRRRFSRKALRNRGHRFTSQQTLHVLRGDGPLKYLLTGDGTEELYDVVSDPHERQNLASDRPAEAASLSCAARELLEERTPGPPAEEQTIDAETREALEALGYVP